MTFFVKLVWRVNKMRNERIDVEISKRISYYRKKRNLSIEEVARLTGMSKAMLYAYESGNRKLTASSLLTLSDLYEVSIDDMLGTKRTSNREKSASFEIYRSNEKQRTVVSSAKDELILYEIDKWNVEYYVKSNEYKFGFKLLIEFNGNVFPVEIRYDESKKLCAVSSFLDGSVHVMSRKEMSETVFVLGEYAGTIAKQKKINEFFD